MKVELNQRFRRAGFVLVMGLLWLVLFLLLADIQAGGDAMSYYAYIRSAVIDGDLNFYNEDGNYNLLRQPMAPYSARTSTGYVPTAFSIGPAILWAPFFLIAHEWAGLSGLPQDGYVFPYIFAVTLGSAFYSTLGLLLVYRVVRAFVPPKAASLAATALWLGSAVTFYTFKDALFSHALSFFAVSLLLYGWHRVRQKPPGNSGLLLVGGLVGLASLMRWQDVLFGVIPGVDLLTDAVQAARRRDRKRLVCVLRGLLFLGMGTVVVFSPQMLAWQVLYRRWFVVPQGEGFLRWAHAQVLNVCFSPYHGLFIYTPLAALGVAGLFLLLRKDLKIALAFLIAVGLQVYISSVAVDWWAGYSFGMRRMVSCTPLLAVGLGVLLEQTGRRKGLQRALMMLVVLLVAWNLLLVVEVGQRSWLDWEDRSFGYYLTALRLSPRLVAEPWTIWKLGFSYLPTLLYGVIRGDAVVLQSAVLLLLILLFVFVAIAVPWSRGIFSRVRGVGTALLLIGGLVVTVDGFILVSDRNTHELYALDLAQSPSRLLYTRIRAGRTYEGLVAQGFVQVEADKEWTLEIAEPPVTADGLEMLSVWQGATAGDATLDISVGDHAGNQVEHFTLDARALSSSQPVQVQRTLEPYPTPILIPYWLLPERFKLRQTPLYLTRVQFRQPLVPGAVRFRLAGEGNWQVHSLSWTPASP